MTTNGKDRLTAALGESYPRVWRGLGLESKTGRNLPDIQDKKRPRADASLPETTRTARGAVPTSAGIAVEGTRGHGDMGTWERQNSKGAA